MSNARSPSGQWYPQNPSWASGATMPVQYSPAGTPPPSPGGYNGNPAMLQQQQQQQQQRANLNGSGVLNNSGTWNGSATPTPPGFGVGGGVMPGQQQMPFGMYGGMNGMNPNMMMMQPSGCCDCCGNQQQSCCGNEQQGCCGGPQGGCCGNQQQGCCGGPQGGCCPMPGEPPDPFVCTSTPMNPACYECIYNCFDYSFLLACVLFALTVVGFGVVVGTKDIDDIYTKFGASNASELDLAMKPYIKWMNPNMCNTTTNESSSSSSADSNLSASSSLGNSASSSLGNSSDDDSQASDTSTIARQRDGLSTPLSVYYYYYAAENEAMVGNSTGSSSDGSGSGNETECLHNYTKPCTERRLKGSFGAVCMEDNLNANVFAVQLSQWNNARDTLWFVAMAFTGFAILYAGLIHSQRHPNPMNMLDGGAFNPATLPPEKQAELMKMTPQQQQQFIMEYQMQQQQQPQLSFSASNMANPNEMNMNAEQQQQMAMMMQQQQQQQGCGPSGSIEFYETPYYEFVRFAWGFVGLTAFVWAINLCLSFWAFSSFYVESTEGPLHDFWKKYAGKFSGSVVVVTVYLAWPLCNVALDAVVMVVGIIPWLVIRSTCKTNIGNYRPNLPVSQLPGWIRTDMFFMDFADLKRLGFSRNAWIILTGSTRPFFDTCCVDPTVDTDPSMTSLLVQRYQFQLQMYAMMPPWMRGMMPPPMPPPQLNMTAEQFQQQFGMAPPGMAGAMGGMYGGAQGGGNAMPGSSAHTPPETALHDPANKPLDGGATPNTARHRRRHRSSGSRAHSVENIAMQDSGATPGEGRRRRTHTHADPAEEAANGADGTPRRRKHRSHSRSRSRSNSKGFNAGEAPTPTADAAGGGGAAAALLTPTGGEKSENHRHRRRSHSRSMSREVAVPVADDPSGAAATPGGGSKSRRHHHRSTSVPAEEGASRSRRHSSRSKSRSRSKGKGRSKKDKKDKKDKKADNELDALMQL